jgi:hypothetical protein
MKQLLIAFVLLTIPLHSYSDAGNAYIFKVEVKYDKGTVKGYIFLADYFIVDSTEEKQYYANDSLFTSLVKMINHRDSLSVYSGLYSIDSLYLHIFFNDKGVKIDENKIISIKLRGVKAGYIGSWVSPYRFSVKDLSWLKKPFLYKEDYETQGCRFTLYFFQKPKTAHPIHKEKSKYLDKELWNLTAEESVAWDKLLMDYLKFIEKEKVILREDCGC